MLIPVDLGFLQRYIKWLVRRELTDPERCTYALGGKDCLTEASKTQRSLNEEPESLDDLALPLPL